MNNKIAIKREQRHTCMSFAERERFIKIPEKQAQAAEKCLPLQDETP